MCSAAASCACVMRATDGRRLLTRRRRAGPRPVLLRGTSGEAWLTKAAVVTARMHGELAGEMLFTRALKVRSKLSVPAWDCLGG